MSAQPLRRLVLTAYAIGDVVPSLVPAPLVRDWMSETPGRYAYRCLPLVVANQSGWCMLNPHGLTATWSGSDDVGAVEVIPDEGASIEPAHSHFGDGVLTWDVPFVFRTPPGFDLLVRGPANHPKDAICALEGIVETDWTSATFTMNWKFTRPGTPVRFEKDEPVCMIVPRRRGELEAFEPEVRPIDSDDVLRWQHAQWSAHRAAFLHDLSVRPPAPGARGWQRHYTHGVHATGEPGASAHQTRMRLLPFNGEPDSDGRGD